MALVIDPWHTEDDLALGFHNTLNDVVFFVFRVLVQQGTKGCQHFFYGLIKLQLSRTGSLQLGDGLRYVWHVAPLKISYGYVLHNWIAGLY